MNKKQWKNVTENLSLQFSTKSNWSQEEPDAPTMDLSEIRSFLPTKTSATRQISDLENIPQNGPFLLNFSNIPFDADENAIRHFFQSFDVVNVVKSEQKRGTGIIEFKDRISLTGALGMAEKQFISRPIRLTIGYKEDFARIQSGVGQRGRYQNQQRNPPSTLSEDSDNWRTKKPQPVSQASTDNFPPKNERSNWREKPINRNEEKPITPSENTGNWRRLPAANVKSGNFTRQNQPMHESPKPPTVIERPESKESDTVKETKKVSIFGDAKPVDTQAKYMEVEQKIEQSKKQTVDEPHKIEQPISSSSNPWVNKKQANPSVTTVTPVSEKPSDNNNWRSVKKVPITSKSFDSTNQRESIVKADPTPAPVEAPKPVADIRPAPIPVNVWEERKKSKALSTQNVYVNNSASRVTVATATIAQPTPPTAQDSSSHVPPHATAAIAATATSPAVYQSVPGNSALSQPTNESKAIQKPPVVISANGPFLDPKSRTPHHSMSDSSSNKAPTAVPINKSLSPIDTACKEIECPRSASLLSDQQLNNQSKQPATVAATAVVAAANTCGKQSSWSRGPPKGLIEKPEINQ